MRNRQHNRGMTSVLAVVFLMLFAALAATSLTMSNATLTKADNQSHVQEARFQAESGMEYCRYHLSRLALPDGIEGASLQAAVTAALPVAAGTELHPDGQSDRGFTAAWSVNTTVLTLTVSGRRGTITRSISADYNLVPGGSGVFDYGVATKGHVVLTGNASIEGVNHASEGTMYAGTMTTDEVFDLTGNCDIAGDLHAPNPNGYVSMTGNCTLGGGGDPADHIHIGVPEVPFPEVNPAVFEPFATNVLSGSTSGNKTFTNLRIPAGRNPTFAGNITVKGVLFIEQPNRVRFTGNLTMTGVVVTQDAGDDNYDTCTIKFTGNSTFRGVEELPDTPEFASLKLLPGSFLLAPGFGAEFTGNFGTVNGTMAADQFKWTGNAGGIVKGSVICYADNEFKMTGNSSMRFDRSDGTGTPPGFSMPATFAIVPGSYQEH